MKLTSLSIFNYWILLSAMTILNTGCIGEKKLVVKFNNPSAFTDLKLNVNTIQVQNNQLVINGNGLSSVSSITLTNGGVSQTLAVESANNGQIVANGIAAVSLGVGKVFDIVLSNAYGSATFPVSFTLDNGTVTAAQLSSMGATTGQILKFNGTNWGPASQQDVQTYIGVWDASTLIPDVTLSSAGDYYIVSVAAGAYSVGDWIVSDGYSWAKIPYSKTSVASFQGRKGNVVLVPADYVTLKDSVTHKITGSSINDLADLDLTTVAPTNGSILKYNGTKWVVGTDNAGVASGSIVDSDISGTAAIAQSKINGLATSLSAKEDAASLAADVRATPLTGLTTATGSLAATDTILGAFGKMMNTQSDYVSKSSGASIATGTIAVSGTGMITVPTATGVTATEVANVTYVANAIAANGVWDKNGTMINYGGGNVGIGTTTPTANLEIKGTTAAGSQYMTVTQETVNSSLSVYSPTFASSAYAGRSMLYASGKLDIRSDNSEVNFYLNGKSNTGYQHFRVVPNGVIIGTYDGSTVAGGTGYVTAPSVAAGTADIAGGHLAIRGGASTGTGLGGTIQFLTAQAAAATATTVNAWIERMRITQTGNIGIGTTTPTGGKLSIFHQVDPGTTPAALDIVTPGTGGGTATPQYGIRVNAVSYNNSSIMYGVYSKATQNTALPSYGVYGETGGSATQNTYGVYGMGNQINTAGGGISYGVYGTAVSAGANGTGKTYAGYFDNQAATGNTAVGLYVNSIAGATNNYSALFMGGNVGIGTTSPTQQLHLTNSIQIPATTTSTTGVIYKGVNRFMHDFAPAGSTGLNTFVGTNAGNFTMTYAAGHDSSYLTAIGYKALFANTTGSDNTALGYNALLSNTSGTYNTALGEAALSANTTGNSNVAAGQAALGANTTGYNNTAIGYSALGVATTATNNTATGFQALVSTVTGGQNTANGFRSLISSTGSNNTAYGYQSGYDITTGSFNILLGSYLGATGITTGSNNILVGQDVRPASQTASNQMNIGNLLYATGLGSGATASTGYIGIGTNAPTQKLHIVSNAQSDKALVVAGSSLDNNWGGGLTLTSFNGTTTNSYLLVSTNGLDINNTLASPIRLFTNNAERMRVDSAGNVGIGTIAPGYKLQVGAAADGSEARANAWNVLSDERLKRDFELIPHSLEKILSLNGYYYYWNRGTDTSKKMGLKAQEVEKVYPEVVSHGTDGFLSVSYNHLVAGVIAAVKEFYHKWLDDSQNIHRAIASVQTENSKIKFENARIKEENARMKSENAAIKKALCELGKKPFCETSQLKP
jgi:hypothetical protein